MGSGSNKAVQENIKILGIDPGSRVLGWGVITWQHGAEVRVGDFGAIRVKARDSTGARLVEINGKIGDVLRQVKPDAVVVEEVFYGKNFQSALRIGEARGVCLLAAALLGVATYSYAAAEIKSAVTGNGRAHKAQVQAMVARLLKLETIPGPADVADALACALCHSHRLSLEAALQR